MKRFLEKIKQMLQGISIVIAATLMMQIISAVQYIYTRNTIEGEARKMAEIRLGNADLLIDGAMNGVEVAVNNMAPFIQKNLHNETMLFTLTKGLLDVNNSIEACGVLFEPDYDGRTGAFHPSAYRDSEEVIHSHDNALNGFNFYERAWYINAMGSGHGSWTDPYISKTTEMLICTFSVPVRDENGRSVGVLYADVSMRWLEEIVRKGAAAYENAFGVVLNKTGLPIIDTRGGELPGGFLEVSDEMMRLEKGEQIISYNDTVSYAFYSPIGRHGWSMAIVCPKSEMFKDFYKVARILVCLMLFGVLLMCFILYRVAKGYNQLQNAEDTRKRIENELSIAHGIQMGMIPKIFPPYPERDDIEIHASLTAAKEVGGDLYDFFISGDKLWFCIGDVSGKGVPASLVMAVTRSLFRTEAMHKNNPAKLMRSMNSAMSEMNENNMFVTFIAGQLDLTNGVLEYCNAGHNAPVIYGEGKREFLQMKPNIPLGLIQDYNYQSDSITLKPGYGLFLYTDGLTEAENASKELFGEDRMLQALDPEASPGTLISEMYEAVEKHAAGAEQSDDLTMLAIRYQGGIYEQVTINNIVDELEVLPELIEKLNLDPIMATRMNLALEEAATNSVLYAYDRPGIGKVTISACATDKCIKFMITDKGKPFDPTLAEEPDVNMPGEERPIGGLGIFLVRKIMDSVTYERRDAMNILIMTKNL